MRILIAEDEENIARGIETILLSQRQYKPQTKIAENGQKALEIANLFDPDLVITDIRMFKMNGLELAWQLKENNLCGNVIIISGYSNFEYAQKALRAGVLDYLLKPIDKQRLLELVQKVWEVLPENYATGTKIKIYQDYEFFQVDFEKKEYPGSLKKAIAFIKKNYMRDISLQMLSDELMLHPNYISTLINKYIHVNFNYILDYIRLEKACELLISYDMTISEISYIVGYSNERRLYHAFQKRMSCTPGDFRKK